MELQGLSALKSLTEWVLKGCKELAELPTLPRRLFKAHIGSCSQLKRMSFNMSQMNELKVLKVCNCESLMEFQGFGALKSLTKLHIWGCKELAELPTLPRGLVKARIESCSGLKRISFDMSPTNEFKVLKVSNCESLIEIHGPSALKSLTELELRGSNDLAELPTLQTGFVKAELIGRRGLH